jgi:N6-adenosine-specific RNA methylase IME4
MDEIAPLPDGKFAVIYADPAWAFKTYERDDAVPARRDPYRTMPMAQIRALPVAEVAAKDAHLFLWITGPLLAIGAHIPVMRDWGFKPTAMGFTWVKLKASHNPLQMRVVPTADHDLFVGMGYTTRKNAEFCIIGRRGSPKRLARDVREVILSPVREHSRKPDDGYERIERYCPGPRLELFARTQRPGWTAWGNQMDKFT